MLWHHAFRNALIPLITLLGIVIPYLLSGSVIVEQIFQWDGIGLLYYDAILSRDYPVVMGLTVITAVVTLLASLLADVLYAFADPRVRLGEGAVNADSLGRLTWRRYRRSKLAFVALIYVALDGDDRPARAAAGEPQAAARATAAGWGSLPRWPITGATIPIIDPPSAPPRSSCADAGPVLAEYDRPGAASRSRRRRGISSARTISAATCWRA